MFNDTNFFKALVNLNLLVRSSTDPERAFFQKSQTFGLWQTFWDEIFWSIWGNLGQIISIHFGTVSSLSMFFIIQPLFLQKTNPWYPTPIYLFWSGIWIWAAKNLRLSLRVSVVHVYSGVSCSFHKSPRYWISTFTSVSDFFSIRLAGP